MNFTPSEEARFLEKIERRGPDECWPWAAKARHRFGYGVFAVKRGDRWKQYTASRAMCALAHGEPPSPKAHALHSCDNPICCNPAHLRWGTPKENTADAVDRGRQSMPPRNAAYRRRDTQPKGAQVWNQTLTEEKVRAIWRMHLAGEMNVSQIAAAVDAKPHTVADVVRGRNWRHLDGAPSVEALRAGGVRRGSNGFNELARQRVLEVRKAKG